MPKPRCAWSTNDPLYIKYHDEEWGVPVHDDRLLFEFLLLEGAQAGLNWLTILKKRDNYRKAFEYFEPALVAGFDNDKIDRLMADPGIIRNRLKIGSAVGNAEKFLDICQEFNSFDRYIWSFVKGKPIINAWKNIEEIPSQTEISSEMSRDLKKRGFKFVGPTICYAFMQAVGMVNDHIITCFRYNTLIHDGNITELEEK